MLAVHVTLLQNLLNTLHPPAAAHVINLQQDVLELVWAQEGPAPALTDAGLIRNGCASAGVCAFSWTHGCNSKQQGGCVDASGCATSCAICCVQLERNT